MYVVVVTHEEINILFNKKLPENAKTSTSYALNVSKACVACLPGSKRGGREGEFGSPRRVCGNPVPSPFRACHAG